MFGPAVTALHTLSQNRAELLQPNASYKCGGQCISGKMSSWNQTGEMGQTQSGPSNLLGACRSSTALCAVYTYPNLNHRITEPRNSPGWKGPQKLIWPKFSWEREPQWDCLATWLVSDWKLSFLYQEEMSPNTTCTHGLLSFACVFLWRRSLCPPCICPLNIGILWWILHKPSLLCGWKI